MGKRKVSEHLSQLDKKLEAEGKGIWVTIYAIDLYIVTIPCTVKNINLNTYMFIKRPFMVLSCQVDSIKRLSSHRDSIFYRSSMVESFLETFIVIKVNIFFNCLY